MIEDSPARYKRHLFPAEIIAHAAWLYYRFPLSLRDVEDLLAERGIVSDSLGVGGKVRPQVRHQLRQRSRGHFADKCTSTRWSCPSRERSSGCGVPSMPIATFSTLFSKTAETGGPLFG